MLCAGPTPETVQALGKRAPRGSSVSTTVTEPLDECKHAVTVLPDNLFTSAAQPIVSYPRSCCWHRVASECLNSGLVALGHFADRAIVVNGSLLRSVVPQEFSRISLPRARGKAPVRKVGVIDVGSNTSRLIILAYTPGASFRLVDQIREQVRLSEGMGDENLLRSEPMERMVRLLRVFQRLCEGNGIDRVLAVGTSAVREAGNRAEFVKRVRQTAGLDLRVLSGEEEAHYGFLAVVNSLAISNGLVLDIGGGSLELVRVKGRAAAPDRYAPGGGCAADRGVLAGGSAQIRGDPCPAPPPGPAIAGSFLG